MLYVFCGERIAARKKCNNFIAACKKKRENAEYIRFSPHLDTPQSLEEVLNSQGLFEKKYIVLCDEILENREISRHLSDNMREYAESTHMFVVFEPDIAREWERALRKAEATIEQFQERAGVTENAGVLFGFAEMAMKEGKEKTLVALHKLLGKGEDPVSLLNILVWQVRSMAIALTSENQKESGLKPFVYTKARKLAEAQSRSPVRLFLLVEQTIRNGRVTGANDGEILERIILNI